MKICFLDNTNFQYNSNALYHENIRGAESVLINLSNALNFLGHEITIINNCPKNEIINGIRWININSNNIINDYDLVISNGDCNFFKHANAPKKILFSHSLQSIEKFIRKGQLLSYLKYKPKICFISNYHRKKRSSLISLFGNIDLRWSVDDIFLKAVLSENVDRNLAIFTSRPDRNLNILINIWNKYIFPHNEKYKLLVTDDGMDSQKITTNILKRKLNNKNNLVNDLLKSRVFLIPGHKSELFCLAAEEARELCIPIVTLGIGCLSERVEHEKSGFVARNFNEFAKFTINLFKDDSLWKNMRNYLISKRGFRNWNLVAKDLISKV